MGQQLLLDLWLDEPISEGLIARMAQVIRSRFHVVEELRHDFTPEGLTLVYILSESHFALHTYPAERFISLDLYACTEGSLEDIASELVSVGRVLRAERKILGRGLAGAP